MDLINEDVPLVFHSPAPVTTDILRRHGCIFTSVQRRYLPTLFTASVAAGRGNIPLEALVKPQIHTKFHESSWLESGS